MKRLAAIFLVFCLLLSGVSVAEEVAKEQRFLSGLLALLQSVDLSRDMLTLSADYEGRNVFSGKLKGQDGVTDLSISAEGLALQAQLSEEEIAASLNGNTTVLRFEDVRALAGTAQTALAGLSPEMENIQALLQLFLEKVILPDTSIVQAPSFHIAYQAPLSTVVKRLADFGDAVFEQNQFEGTYEKLAGLIGPYLGQELPEYAQLKAAWPQIREELLAEDTEDLEAALVLAQEDRALTLEGHFGNADRMYEASFALTQGNERFDLTGALSENIQSGEQTRTSGIEVSGWFTGDTGDAQDNAFHLKAKETADMAFAYDLTVDGSMAQRHGTLKVALDRNLIRAGRPVPAGIQQSMSVFFLNAHYALLDDGLSAMAYVGLANGRSVPFLVDLLVSKGQFSLNVTNYNAVPLFGLKLIGNERDGLKQLEFLYRQNVRNTITASYDGEKAVIQTNGLTITCTGAFEADNVWVLTLRAEGDTVQPGQEEAQIRLEYEGEEGQFSLRGRGIGPDGSEYVSASLLCHSLPAHRRREHPAPGTGRRRPPDPGNHSFNDRPVTSGQRKCLMSKCVMPNA